MILSDFLSRQDPGDENTKEIIPISFNMKSVLQDRYYNVGKIEEKYMVQTRSQTKASGVTFTRGAWFKEEIRSP